ncbi:MAG: DUF5682 family protein [Oscillospiraceae bacterium]|jgi:hypothetical protein|nr:DUF5682 family protein [Oscillospiraceae bacterium]
MRRIVPIRHLSPASCAQVLREYENERPDALLVEMPQDVSAVARYLTNGGTKPPVAVMAYAEDAPACNFTLPLTVCSPEYVAITRGAADGVDVRFMDLPSEVFLALPPGGGSDAYAQVAREGGDGDFESYWERCFEHADGGGYAAAAFALGERLRQAEPVPDNALLRESFMRGQIARAEADGYGNILVICGAYHAPALRERLPVMTDDELRSLPRIACRLTLIPYSYSRLSLMAGYGAGNAAPCYYEMLWHGRAEPREAAVRFMVSLARQMRPEGAGRSCADAIEAYRLADCMARLQGNPAPLLRDLTAAATAVFGGGDGEAVAEAVRRAENAAPLGSVPPECVDTALRGDFYAQAKLLKMDITGGTAELALDLRKETARSVFLHRLAALGISFARLKTDGRRYYAQPKEIWLCRHGPDTERELTDCAVFGDTVESAAIHALMAALCDGKDAGEAAEIAREAVLCRLDGVLAHARRHLLTAAKNAVFTELAEAFSRLAALTAPGFHPAARTEALRETAEQLFLGACLELPKACRDGGAAPVTVAERVKDLLHGTAEAGWRECRAHLSDALREVCRLDGCDPFLSGTAFAALCDMGEADGLRARAEIIRRLSFAAFPEYAAGWLDGFAAYNRAGMLANLDVWMALDEYISLCDYEDFLRVAVILRRAFAGFSPDEMRMVNENLEEARRGEMTEEWLRRRRLAFGAAAGREPEGEDATADRLIAALYDTGQDGLLPPFCPAQWLTDTREVFPEGVLRLMHGDAMERRGLKETLFEPDVRSRVAPGIGMATALLEARRKIPKKHKSAVARVVADTTDGIRRDLEKRLQNELRGVVRRARGSPLPPTRTLDWHATIMRNLRYYDSRRKVVVPERFYYRARRGISARTHIIMAIDRSYSMTDSLVHGVVAAGVLCGIPSLSARVAVFDSEVYDMSELCRRDSAQVLFDLPAGGGTDIGNALAYCASLITEPRRTLFVLLSDLYDGGSRAGLIEGARKITGTGARALCLLALTDRRHPLYDARSARELSAAGMECVCAAPERLAEVLGKALMSMPQ